MKIKLLISRAGVDFSQNAGDVITVDDKEGLRMVEAGQASIVQEVEKATSKKVTQKAAK